jgi:hypothetical protein
MLELLRLATRRLAIASDFDIVVSVKGLGPSMLLLYRYRSRLLVEYRLVTQWRSFRSSHIWYMRPLLTILWRHCK